MGIIWVIEADESTLTKPSFFHGPTKGRCFFVWTDDFHLSMKFTEESCAFKYAKNNHLYCGFRVRQYSI